MFSGNGNDLFNLITISNLSIIFPFFVPIIDSAGPTNATVLFSTKFLNNSLYL